MVSRGESDLRLFLLRKEPAGNGEVSPAVSEPTGGFMISFNQVSRHYGTQDVLTRITFEIHPGQKVGLIGPNGAGKTTLVRILVGEEEPSEGSVSLPPRIEIRHGPQHVEPDPEVTVGRFMLRDFSRAQGDLRGSEEA